MGNFKERWNITSNWQYVVIFVVFACTGFTAKWLAPYVLGVFGIEKGGVPTWLYYVLYIILIFPIYQPLLVMYGFLFGQFKLFWAFEKKMLRACGLGFIANWFEKK